MSELDEHDRPSGGPASFREAVALEAGSLPSGSEGYGDLTIVIVTYNSAEQIEACLSSITYNAGMHKYRVIIADNNSSDGCADVVSQRYPYVNVIRLDSNLGFAAAVNIASEAVDSRWMLLLNPDTEVGSGSIGALLSFAESHPERIIYGGRTLFPDGEINPTSCWNRITPWSALCRAAGLSRLFYRSRIFNSEAVGLWAEGDNLEVDIVTGCFFLIKTSSWRELRGFDDRFWMYGEEADLCLRSIDKYGTKPIVTTQAEIVHLNGTVDESVERRVWIAKARATLMRKHWTAGWRRCGFMMLWAEAALRAGAATCLGLLPLRDQAARRDRWMALWRARRECLRGY